MSTVECGGRWHNAFGMHACRRPNGHRGKCDQCAQRGDACRDGCPTKDHATWGDCARAARIQVDRAALAAGRLDEKGN